MQASPSQECLLSTPCGGHRGKWGAEARHPAQHPPILGTGSTPGRADPTANLQHGQELKKIPVLCTSHLSLPVSVLRCGSPGTRGIHSPALPVGCSMAGWLSQGSATLGSHSVGPWWLWGVAAVPGSSRITSQLETAVKTLAPWCCQARCHLPARNPPFQEHLDTAEGCCPFP